MITVLKLGRLTIKDIADLTGGTLHFVGEEENYSFGKLCTDSREADEDTLFIAMKGERVDGNDYIASAISRGCRCVLSERAPTSLDGDGYAAVSVPNAIEALGKIAKAYKKNYKGKTVAVTGSVGKTTTKEFISCVLGYQHKTFKTQGNFNSNIGLPMSILGIDKDDEMAVLEMGMSGFGEIEFMSNVAEPNMAVVTTIGTSHLEMLGSRENICKAKMEITAGLREFGVLLLNGDDDLLGSYPTGDIKKKLVALKNREADFRAVNIRGGIMKTTFDVIYGRKVLTNIEIPTMGEHNVYAALFAIAVGLLYGMDGEHIKDALVTFKNTGMRQNIYDAYGITIIEDCYNASPESMRSGIDVLIELSKKKNTRAVALLGDMLELGENSEQLHREVGRYLAESGAKVLFAYGKRAEAIATSAVRNGMRPENVYVDALAEGPEKIGDMIIHALKRGDVLLVKASRGMAAERVIEYIGDKSAELFS